MYYVMLDGLVLGELYIDDKNQWGFNKDKGVEDNWLPLFLRMTVGLEGDLYDIYTKWLEERVIPPNRMGLKKVLKRLGMPKYDYIELARKTNASMLTDPYWIAYEDTDTFSKNTIRGAYGYDPNTLNVCEEQFRWRK